MHILKHIKLGKNVKIMEVISCYEGLKIFFILFYILNLFYMYFFYNKIIIF